MGLCYIHNGNSYIGTIVSLYRNAPRVLSSQATNKLSHLEIGFNLYTINVRNVITCIYLSYFALKQLNMLLIKSISILKIRCFKLQIYFVGSNEWIRLIEAKHLKGMFGFFSGLALLTSIINILIAFVEHKATNTASLDGLLPGVLLLCLDKNCFDCLEC